MLTPLTSMFGNFLTTSLMDDSNDLSDKNAGFEFASPHACINVVPRSMLVWLYVTAITLKGQHPNYDYLFNVVNTC